MSDSEDDSKEKQLKIAILGEQNVGKTNLIKRFCYDEFSRVYIPTIGADFYIKRITLSGNKEIIVHITDVSGLELHGHMLDTYIFKANLIILVYDITNSQSFDSLIVWLRKLDQITESDTEARTLSIAVLGNKCDLEHKRAVRLDRTNHFIHDNKLHNYFVSAKSGESVNSSFIELAARYFNMPLSNLERDKQKSIIKAELTTMTPPPTGVEKNLKRYSVDKSKQKKKINKIAFNEDQVKSCIIQ